MLKFTGSVAIANGDGLAQFQTAAPGAAQALLALLATRALQGRRIVVWLPEPTTTYKAKAAGSLLLRAEVEGLQGGVLLTRRDACTWEASVHT